MDSVDYIERIRERVRVTIAERQAQGEKASLRSLSLEAGFSESYLKHLLAGRVSEPTGSKLRSLANVLGTSVEWILEGRRADETLSEDEREVIDIWDHIEARDKKDAWLSTGRALRDSNKQANNDE
ncbi:MAG: helix-turn-helix domain-containing protein [Pseudomonadota bacterium]